MHYMKQTSKCLPQVWVGVLPVGPSGVALNSTFQNRERAEYKTDLGNAIASLAGTSLASPTNLKPIGLWLLRKHSFAFLTHVDTDILLRLERHDCTHATVLAKAQKRQAPPAVPEKVNFLTTWADVRQWETAGTVPDGLLVFFPSYGVLQSCVDHWKNTSASGAPRRQCVPIDPGASVVGAFAVACPCAPGALPQERCHASSIWVQVVFMQACQICGTGTSGASIYDRILHCKAALVQPRAPAVRFCCLSTSFLGSEERHFE